MTVLEDDEIAHGGSAATQQHHAAEDREGQRERERERERERRIVSRVDEE